MASYSPGFSCMFLATSCQSSFQDFFSSRSLNSSGRRLFLLICSLLSSWVINHIYVEDHVCSSSDTSPNFQIQLTNFISESFLSSRHLQIHNDPNCIHHYLPKTHLCTIFLTTRSLLSFPFSAYYLLSSASPSHNTFTSKTL